MDTKRRDSVKDKRDVESEHREPSDLEPWQERDLRGSASQVQDPHRLLGLGLPQVTWATFSFVPAAVTENKANGVDFVPTL